MVEETVYRRAMLILSHRDHSVEELRRKLVKRDFSGETIGEVLEKLKRSGLLDDTRFSEAFVREKVRNKPMGHNGLIRELLKRGVSEDIAQDAVRNVLDEEGINEEDLARKLVERRKQRGIKNIADLLRRRGFGGDTIREILEEGKSYR